MKDIWGNIQVAASAIGGFLGYAMGGWDGFLYALVMLTVIDYVTELFVSVIEHELSSKNEYKSIFKKVVIFSLVALAHVIDSQIIQTGSVIRTAVIFFYISDEGISVLENAARLGVPIPKKLRAVLKELNKDNDSDDCALF